MKRSVFGISVFTGIMIILISCATGDLDKIGKQNSRNNPNDPNGVNYSPSSSSSTSNVPPDSSSPSSSPSSSSNAAVIVSTFAGTGTAGNTEGPVMTASFNYPCGVAVDSSGNIYVADKVNNKIREITSSVVFTFAGSGTVGSAEGTGTAASFYNPTGVAVDSSGNIYVADSFSDKIRKITSAGIVSTFAGSGTAGSAEGTGTAASFYNPTGVAVDSSGNIYVADRYNNKIRKITSAGVVSTLAGSGTAGNSEGTETAASFNFPFGIALDSSGNIYVADTQNNKIRKITSAGVVSTLAGSGTAGYETMEQDRRPHLIILWDLRWTLPVISM